ncbi:tsl0367 [Thermosynechococcus vestitus BP-1]|uniref:Tsl0367 protein n=2 Tax=Thermosynechococcus vestitus TaxID=146786 RepID=Q8DLV9_THEVB|nr:tsl0367 [Thermosynechococcus vestitus BP-1]
MAMNPGSNYLIASQVTIEPQIIVAQKFKDTLGEDVSKAWANFVDSGQLWALIIGLAIGWIFGKLLNF